MIPQDYILELTNRCDIVDLVQSYVQLRHRGRTYTGLCPFHNEKTPSFVVYPENQSFYCFGCGAGGSAINFEMRYKNLTYVEAIKELAQRVGMPAPDEEDEAGKLRSRILAINKETGRFFYNSMNSEAGSVCRAYWRSRGLTDATIRRFGLGYAQDSFRALRDHLKAQGFTEEEMISAGVVRRSDKGGTYDFFRHRAMIPIFDLRGNVIAFSGRKLDPEQPGGKYVNSPETPVYKKSRTLFAMQLAKKSASKRYILCEGNLDAISMHQAGFDTAVAGCGTALTPEQVKIISDYADEIVLCYDSDEPGQIALGKAINLFKTTPLKISVLRVPNAKDPDEFINKFGAEAFEKLLNGSANAVEYALQQAKAKYDITTADGRVQYVKDAIEVLAGRVTPTERDVYAGRIAEETDVAKSAIITQLEAAMRTHARIDKRRREKQLLQEGAAAHINVPYQNGGRKALGVVFAEQMLMLSVLKNPDYLPVIAARVTPQQFISPEMAQVFTCLLAKQADRQYIELSVLAAELPEGTVSLLSSMLAQHYDIKISPEDVEMYLQRVERADGPGAEAAAGSVDDFAAFFEKKRQQHALEEDAQPEE